MPEEKDSPRSAPLNFITTCMNAIGERRYREALTILEKGIDEHLTAPESQTLLKDLQTLLAYLDFRLGEDFGAYWDPGPRTESENQLRCSFCGRNEEDVEEMIAGPGVFICKDCIKRSADALVKKH